MYIYELPFEKNKELCRLLDHDDDWKELAGVHMQYSPFDVNEIEQQSKRNSTSPSNNLFTRWGQLNHRVEELFILLHKMKHVPAMHCLASVVGERFHKMLRKDISRLHEQNTAALDDNNKHRNLKEIDSSLPLPVMLIEQGVQLPSSSKVLNAQSHTDDSTSENNTTSTNGTHSNKDFNRVVSEIPMFSYEELQKATGNWNESNLLGRGGFGQVYKGELRQLPVAVKKLNNNDGKNKELISEMCLNRYRHDNILPLYGYSLGGPEACLVTQLMLGGSLEQRLRRRTPHAPLAWPQRARIAHGVARGLLYLHTMAETPLIHGDIKPANILLDQCTIPKISDFGLARKGPNRDDKSQLTISRVHGTRAYLPDEYVRSHCLSPAVDVYSFGVVLLELGSALPALGAGGAGAGAGGAGRGRQLLADLLHDLLRDEVDLATLEDPILRSSPGSRPALCRAVMALGAECSRPLRKHRPDMMTVFTRVGALGREAGIDLLEGDAM